MIAFQVKAGLGCDGTLDGLTLSFETVVLGEITSFKETEDDYYTIEILVNRNLKGNISKKSVTAIAPFDFNTQLAENGLLLLFLKEYRLDTSKYLLNNCWIIDIEKSNDIRLKRVNDYIQIEKIKDDNTRSKKIIQWYFKCLQNDTTRYTSIIGFSKRGPFFKYNVKKERYERNKNFKLSKEQKILLRKYFLNKTNFEYYDVFIVDLIRKRKDPEILNKLVQQLKLYDETDKYYNSSNRVWFREFNIMEEILKFTNDSELIKIYDRIKEIGFYSISQEIQELTFNFIKRTDSM